MAAVKNQKSLESTEATRPSVPYIGVVGLINVEICFFIYYIRKFRVTFVKNLIRNIPRCVTICDVFLRDTGLIN